MAQAILLCFDQETDERLTRLDKSLRLNGLNPYPSGLRVTPHISLAAFADSLPEELLEKVEVCARGLPALDVRLDHLGMFPGEEGVLFVGPVVNRELLIVHAALHRMLKRGGAISNPYYLPGEWTPHCTVAVGVSPEQIPLVVTLANEAGVFGPARLNRLQVIDYPPVEELVNVPLLSD